jgi:hypothetical protein
MPLENSTDENLDTEEEEDLESPVQGGRVAVSQQEILETDSTAKLNPRQELELRKEKMRQENEENYTFKPALSTSHRDRGRDPKAVDESRFDKLYGDALKRHLQSQWKNDAVDNKETPFVPKLATRGRSSTRGGSTSRSSSKERSEPFHARLSNTTSPKPLVDPYKELTFKPSITKRGKSIERAELKDPAERLYHHNQFLKGQHSPILLSCQ